MKRKDENSNIETITVITNQLVRIVAVSFHIKAHVQQEEKYTAIAENQTI